MQLFFGPAQLIFENVNDSHCPLSTTCRFNIWFGPASQVDALSRPHSELSTVSCGFSLPKRGDGNGLIDPILFCHIHHKCICAYNLIFFCTYSSTNLSFSPNTLIVIFPVTPFTFIGVGITSRQAKCLVVPVLSKFSHLENFRFFPPQKERWATQGWENFRFFPSLFIYVSFLLFPLILLD